MNSLILPSVIGRTSSLGKRLGVFICLSYTRESNPTTEFSPPLSNPYLSCKMDSLAWHEAEASAIRAAAARCICQNPGTDLSPARRLFLRTGSSDHPSQSGLDPEESTPVNTTQSRGFAAESSGNTATPNNGKVYDVSPLRTAQQSKAVQSVDHQAALQTSQSDNTAPEQVVSTGETLADRDLNDEEDDGSKEFPEPSKLAPNAQLSPCDNCQKKHARCNRARPRCRRCKEARKKCIYPQEENDDAAAQSLTNPKRSPRGLACSACRQKGLKSPGEWPECGNSKDLLNECFYEGRGIRQLAMREDIVLF